MLPYLEPSHVEEELEDWEQRNVVIQFMPRDVLERLTLRLQELTGHHGGQQVHVHGEGHHLIGQMSL